MINTTITTVALRSRAFDGMPVLGTCSAALTVHVPADLGRDYAVAAKQGSPPRGVPR